MYSELKDSLRIEEAAKASFLNNSVEDRDEALFNEWVAALENRIDLFHQLSDDYEDADSDKLSTPSLSSGVAPAEGTGITSENVDDLAGKDAVDS